MSDFTIEDIHKKRRELDNMSPQQRRAYIKEKAAPILARLKNAKFSKTALF